METHKFISHSARDAVARIQARLGPDAVVIEVRELPRRLFRRASFEVTATAQASAAPSDPVAELRGEIRQLQQAVARRATPEPLLAPLLIQAGLLPVYAEKIAAAAGAQTAGMPEAEQQGYLREILKANWREPAALGQARAHVFIGTSGCGKSTVLCKWLAQQILSENRGAAVCQLDTHTANLSPQPRLYSEILGARFARTQAQATGADTVFVDLPGIELADRKGLAAARAAIAEFPGAAVHLVLNGAYEAQLLLDQAAFFAPLAPASLILTHLDEERRWGKFWNLVFGTKIGIRFLSLGQNVPGGLVPAGPGALSGPEIREKGPVLRDFEAGKPPAKEPSEFAGR